MSTAAISGGFDPVHVGHLDLIKEASKYGDVIVLLNSDRFLHKKKGYAFMPQSERKELLESFRHVTAVIDVIDKDMTVCKTLEQVRPDYFINGGDRNSEKVIPEAEICKRLGIEMVFTGQPKRQSSSWLCQRFQ